MANDDEPTRTQPEFSPGERIARIEAEIVGLGDEKDELQKQMDRRFKQHEELFDQKLWGLGERLAAISNAQKEAVSKSEDATQRTLQAITEGIERSRKETSEASDRYRREVAKRLETLEQGQSAGWGKSTAAAEYKGSTLAWATVLATVLGGSVFALVIHALGG